MVPLVFLLMLAAQGNGQAIDLNDSEKCTWQVYECYKDFHPIYNALQSLDLEPLSKGRNLVDMCRRLPKAIQCEQEVKCDYSRGSKYIDSATELYEFVCSEKDIIKMERQCWKNSDYRKGLKYCTNEFKLRASNEVCTDMGPLKGCLSKKIEKIEDCDILADIFLDYLLDKIATHFIGNTC